MKGLCTILFFLLTALISRGQSAEGSTEFQTAFIDITGLFGLNEPAQVTTILYTTGNVQVNGLHAFSWKEPGRTIQSFFGVGYRWKLDSTGSKSIAVRNDFAFNRVADDASFLRPMITLSLPLGKRQRIGAGSWYFFDTRTEPTQPLNGGVSYLSHTVTFTYRSISIRNELRLVYAYITAVRTVGGVTEQLRVLHRKSRLYVVSNIGYSFYRSDQRREFIWNVGAGWAF